MHVSQFLSLVRRQSTDCPCPPDRRLGPAPLPMAKQRVKSVSWRYIWLCLSICLLLSGFMLVSCSIGNTGGGGNSPTSTGQSTPAQVALAKLHWCNKAFIVFRDEHAPVKVTPTGTPATATATSTAAANSTPTTLTDWSQIEPNLGFSVFLPVTLPGGTCLVSASGTLNDPIFGGNFIIGYLLPDNSPLSLSEAPLRTASHDFQCTTSKSESPQMPNGANKSTPTASPTKTPILLCSGAKDNTSIVFSGRGSEASLKQFFDALQPRVAWVPGS